MAERDTHVGLRCLPETDYPSPQLFYRGVYDLATPKATVHRCYSILAQPRRSEPTAILVPNNP